jgi:Fe-S cluster assembly ATP-binding protein
MSVPMLELKNLRVVIGPEHKEILKGVNLKIPAGEVHVIMGPNGSGKSTLSYTIMGHPRYKVTDGDILLNGESVLNLSADERARKGIFLSFQSPVAIPGVTVNNFMRQILGSVRGAEVNFKEFRKEMKEAMESLQMNEDFAKRYVNDGFSGGERKRNEILQMSMMAPKFAVLDEIDSGLDIDALRVIATNIEKLRSPKRSMLLITHYQRLLNYLTVDAVHVYKDGQIIESAAESLQNVWKKRDTIILKPELRYDPDSKCIE